MLQNIDAIFFALGIGYTALMFVASKKWAQVPLQAFAFITLLEGFALTAHVIFG